MEQTIRLGVPYSTAFWHRAKNWMKARNGLYSRLCGFEVSNGVVVRNGVLMPLCGVLSLGLATVASRPSRPKLKGVKISGGLAAVPGISRTFASLTYRDYLSEGRGYSPNLIATSRHTGGEGVMSYGGRLSETGCPSGKSLFVSTDSAAAFSCAPRRQGFVGMLTNRGKMTKKWMRARNGLYSRLCGFEVSNGVMVRNGMLMPLCGVLSLGLATVSLLGSAALGLATVALAWNLLNGKEEKGGLR